MKISFRNFVYENGQTVDLQPNFKFEFLDPANNNVLETILYPMQAGTDVTIPDRSYKAKLTLIDEMTIGGLSIGCNNDGNGTILFNCGYDGINNAHKVFESGEFSGSGVYNTVVCVVLGGTNVGFVAPQHNTSTTVSILANPITLGDALSGVVSPYSADYRLKVFKGTTEVASLTTTQGFGSSASWNYTPTEAGTYTIRVWDTSLNIFVSALSDNIVVDSVPLAISEKPILTSPLREDINSTIGGAGVIGATIKVFKDGTELTTITVNAQGNWSYPQSATGSYTFKQLESGKTVSDATEAVIVAINCNVLTHEMTLGTWDTVGQELAVFIQDGIRTIAQVVERDAAGKITKIYGFRPNTFLEPNNYISSSVTSNYKGKHICFASETSTMSVDITPSGYTKVGDNWVLNSIIPPAISNKPVITSAMTATGNSTITGTGVAGAGIKVFKDSTELTTITVDAQGNWSYPQSATGSYTFKQLESGKTVSDATVPVVVSAVVPPSPTAPSPPIVTEEIGKIKLIVAEGGILRIFKNGVEIGTQAVTNNFNYVPTAEGSYTFKLETANGLSRASTAVVVSNKTFVLELGNECGETLQTWEVGTGSISDGSDAGNWRNLPMYDGTKVDVSVLINGNKVPLFFARDSRFATNLTISAFKTMSI